MSIDRALRQLHVALFDDFAALSGAEQSTIIITLEDLVDKLALGAELPNRKEPPPCPKNHTNPDTPCGPSG